MTWTCPACAASAQTPARYPPGPDVYCAVCRRPLDAQERIAAGVAELVKHLAGNVVEAPTAGVDEAAKILRTTKGSIYAMHSRGQLPRSIGRGRRLVWRTEDLLACRDRRGSFAEKGERQ